MIEERNSTEDSRIAKLETKLASLDEAFKELKDEQKTARNCREDMNVEILGIKKDMEAVTKNLADFIKVVSEEKEAAGKAAIEKDRDKRDYWKIVMSAGMLFIGIATFYNTFISKGAP